MPAPQAARAVTSVTTVAAGRELRLDPPAEAVVFMGPDRALERIAVTEVVLREGEVLAAVELATVCACARHAVAGRRRVAVPQVLGHEQVGRIVAFGPGPTPSGLDGQPLAVGDRILWGTEVACGSCRACLRRTPERCEHPVRYGEEQTRRGRELAGGIATHAHLLARTSILRVGEDLPAELLAPASCATATAAAVLDAARALRRLDGEIVLVSGCGMLGLGAIAMAVEAGAHVVGVDPSPARRCLAWDFGADAVAEPTGPSVREAVALAGRAGRVAATDRTGFAAGLELSGAPGALSLLLEAADVGAVIVLAGSVFAAPPVPVSAERVVRRLLTIRGVHDYRPEHLARAVAFLERADRRAFRSLVGDILPFSEAERALADEPDGGVRTGIRMPAATSPGP